MIANGVGNETANGNETESATWTAITDQVNADTSHTTNVTATTTADRTKTTANETHETYETPATTVTEITETHGTVTILEIGIRATIEMFVTLVIGTLETFANEIHEMRAIQEMAASNGSVKNFLQIRTFPAVQTSDLKANQSTRNGENLCLKSLGSLRSRERR